MVEPSKKLAKMVNDKESNVDEDEIVGEDQDKKEKKKEKNEDNETKSSTGTNDDKLIDVNDATAAASSSVTDKPATDS